MHTIVCSQVEFKRNPLLLPMSISLMRLKLLDWRSLSFPIFIFFIIKMFYSFFKYKHYILKLFLCEINGFTFLIYLYNI